MKKKPQTYIPFYTTGAFNHFLKISHEDSTDNLLLLECLSKNKCTCSIFFPLSWWLTTIQYTDSTETAVVAFLFSVSRTQFFGCFFS